MANERSKGRAEVEKKAQALEKLTIEYLPVSEIRPNDYNPNRQNEHEFALLCRSITEDGFTQPVIISMDGVIVDGEHRWRAAQHLGYAEVPVVRVPMEAAQAKIATLRHNRARGSEDLELSVAVLRDLEALGALDWAADSLDLSDDELNRLLEDVPAPEILAGEEFSEAWTPSRDAAAAQEGTVQRQADGATTRVDSTPEALLRGREQEKRLAEAKTLEERAQVARDTDIYRLALSFAGDEARAVKAVLGDTPAIRIVELCNAELAKTEAASEQ